MSHNDFLDRPPEDWIALLDQGASIDDLAEAILSYLDLDSDEQLLALLTTEDSFRDRLMGYFRSAAGESESDETRHLLALCEGSLEASAQYASATAFYALLHDALFPLKEGLPFLESSILRFKLGHTLLMEDEYDEERIRRCADFARRTLVLLEGFSHQPENLRSAADAVKFELQTWLGDRLDELGRFSEAAAAYGQAVILADNADDRISNAAQMASAMAKAGKPQKALELMLLRRDELADVEDPEIRELWVATEDHLHHELGSRGGPPADGLTKECFSRLQEHMQRALSGQGLELPSEELLPIQELLQIALDETPKDEPEARHGLLLQQALLAGTAGKRREAERLLDEAMELEDHFSAERARIERLHLTARQRFHEKDYTGAVALHRQARRLNPEVLDDSRRIALLGEHLHALGGLGHVSDLDEVISLTDELIRILRRHLWSQPLGPARRRARDMAQRPLSAAVLALWRFSELTGPKSGPGQRALAKAWAVIQAGRNPELQGASPGRASASADPRLQLLEESFHRSLRQAQIETADEDWAAHLEQLQEQELALIRDLREPPPAEPFPPARCPAVAFFQVGDLLKDKPFLVIFHEQGRFAARLLAEATGFSREPLLRWGAAFHRDPLELPRPPADSRGEASYRHVKTGLEATPEDLTPPPPLESLLPDAVSTPADTCLLFPDGVLMALPLEMLPASSGSKEPWGIRAAVRMGLRSAPSPLTFQPLSLEGGWLGLGDVPEAGPFDHLKGTKREIEEVQQFIEAKGNPAWSLLGADANEENLRAGLADHQPAILHIAAHGSANEDSPDACALILADSPSLPQRELLPYRRVLALPLQGVELVVLSACSTLIGTTSWSASMQGLTWAFLEAGVGQVLASRYPVDDEATVTFMLTFYRHLQSRTAAEALTRTRKECLTEHRLSQREVGAWSIWC